MSRLTKFLRQECTYQAILKGQVDMYGEQLYGAPQQIKCRSEKVFKKVQTSNGSIIECNTKYFLDDTVTASVGDLVDEHPIVDFEQYTNVSGSSEGYVCYV